MKELKDKSMKFRVALYNYMHSKGEISNDKRGMTARYVAYQELLKVTREERKDD